jgi:putative membrane protein
MRAFFTRLIITAFGLWVADAMLGGIRFDGVLSLWIAALLLGMVNAFIRPVFFLLTLPFTLLTLGLFVFIINGLMVLLVAALMPSFHTDGLGPAVLASIIVGLVAWVANAIVGDKHSAKVKVIRQSR